MYPSVIIVDTNNEISRGYRFTLEPELINKISSAAVTICSEKSIIHIILVTLIF
jgi:hypothetical protein